jgi:Calx-beta domain
MAGRNTVKKNFRRRLAGAVVVATVAVGIVGAGVAYANVGFSVPSPNGLTDGQSVEVVLTGINAVAFATVSIAECANAYTDNTALPAFNPLTDCQVLGQIDVSSTPTLTTSVTVTRTGIGPGNRSCVSGGNFSCDLRVSQMKNQLTSPLPPPVSISFATDPPAGTPDATTTTVSETGAPAALGKTAYAHVLVESLGNFDPEGNVTVKLDGVQVATGSIGTDGTVNAALGTPALGDHTLDAQFDGNGSFSASTATTATFKVIGANNISVGDVSVVEGVSGFRKIAFPVVLSQRSLVPVTVNYSVNPGTATSPADFSAVAGTLKFPAGATIKYVLVKVFGDTILEGNETFTVDLSSPTAGWDLRRSSGVGTIIDDEGSPVPAVGIGDASVPEGDVGGTHTVKMPVTLSNPLPVAVTVSVTLSTVSAIHHALHIVGDWGGPIQRVVKLSAGQLRANLSIPTYPDVTDEMNLTIHANITLVTSTAGVAVQRSLGTATILSDE